VEKLLFQVMKGTSGEVVVPSDEGHHLFQTEQGTSRK
jgi:hypothetical protein